jgi:hypothetical protein
MPRLGGRFTATACPRKRGPDPCRNQNRPDPPAGGKFLRRRAKLRRPASGCDPMSRQRDRTTGQGGPHHRLPGHPARSRRKPTPVVASLLRAGRARIDPLRLGLDVSPRGRAAGPPWRSVGPHLRHRPRLPRGLLGDHGHSRHSRPDGAIGQTADWRASCKPLPWPRPFALPRRAGLSTGSIAGRHKNHADIGNDQEIASSGNTASITIDE